MNRYQAALLGIVALAFTLGFMFGWEWQLDRITSITSQRDELHAIADMREALFQQDERKLDALRWCLKLSPTPIGCVSWSLENTR